MKRWGKALQSGDAETLARSAGGTQRSSQIDEEIRSFVRGALGQIYGQSRYGYSKKIRGEIEEVFGVTSVGKLCALSLRSLKRPGKGGRSREGAKSGDSLGLPGGLAEGRTGARSRK